MDKNDENNSEDAEIVTTDCRVLNDESCEYFVTSVNTTTGRTLRLPAHNKTLESGGWQVPGAWTDDDDKLDEEDLKILSSLSCPTSYKKEGCNRAI